MEQLDLDAVRPLWDAAWRADQPDASDAARAQLTERYLREEPVVDLRYLAIREDGEVVAAADICGWLDVHVGRTDAPQRALEELMAELVRRPVSAQAPVVAYPDGA